MFRSKKSSSPHVSPLAPPAQGSNGLAGSTNGSSQVNGHNRTNDTSASRSPVYTPGATMNRSKSSETTGSSKGEKRRSGFFGLGKKKEEKKEEPIKSRPNSFSVDRPPPGTLPKSRQGPSSHSFNAQQQSQDFQPYSMRQFPPPQNGVTPPPPATPPLPQDQRNNIPRPGNDLNPQSNGSYPTSQSMSFASRQGGVGEAGVPESRGFFHGQQNRLGQAQSPSPGVGQGRPQNQGSVPRSSSMPIAQGSGTPDPNFASTQTPADRGTPPAQRSSQEQGASRGADSGAGAANGPGSGDSHPTWMKQFTPIVELIAAQSSKTYVASPPELEMILARTSAGGQPKQGQPGSVGNDWDGVWLQLSGISLSMWSMKETRIAAAKGEKVPPTYFNVTDSSLELLSPLPPPPHRPDSHPHRFVFSLNTAGSNRLLFSCPTEKALAHWATGLRLAAWERARLEEIYTGHLIRSTGREPRTSLVKGRIEGWVRVRVMGGIEWKRLWLVLSTPGNDEHSGSAVGTGAGHEDEKKSRRRSFFGIGGSEKHTDTVIQEPNTGVCMASFYAEPRTVKNKTQVALLTITDVTQAYAVFPERLEVMTQSNLMKVIGRVGGDLVTIEGRLRDSGWALIMPESPGEGTASPPPANPLVNMMRWVTGFHDVFGLYGRPEEYTWELQDPKSLWFAYPQGDDRGRLFLEVDDALQGDFRGQNLARIRSQYRFLTAQRGQAGNTTPTAEDEPVRPEGTYRLPPLSFGEPSPRPSQNSDDPRSLTPITERASRENSTRTTSSSQRFSTDRKTSTASSKQGSGASNRHPSGTIDGDRLEPIADSSETFGRITEEPSPASPQDTTPQATPSMESPWSPNGGGTERSTVWSQDTGVTPAQSAQLSPISAQPLTASSGGLNNLPPVQAAEPETQPAGKSTTVSVHSDRTIPDPNKSPSPAPLAPPLPTINPTPGDAEVLSPTPRRVSSGSFDKGQTTGGLRDGALHEEPAAMYLMNMVEEPAQVTSPPPNKSPSGEKQRPTVITTFDSSKPVENLGRKPSGARAPPPRKSTGPRNLEAIGDGTEHSRVVSSSNQPDLGEDARMFMDYGEESSPPAVQKKTEDPPEKQPEFGSSFALSKAAAERRAKAEEEAEAKRRAMSLPGGGRRTAGQGGKAEWSGSEDEDEDEDSPVVDKPRDLPSASVKSPVQRSTSRALPPVPQPGSRVSTVDDHRNHLPPPAQHDRPRSSSPAPQAVYHQQNLVQPLRQLPQPNRQTVWNANFDSEHGLDPNRSNKFVELDQPNQLTAAFAPHGLLQAGIQDKEDRSAKKQEELARETGSSLLNVPSKPPPPQTGLLGAVAAHERDRQGAGGIGATITDRERERRLAEERQRKIDELQREQMEHMAQYGGGDGYGGQNPYNRMSMMGGMGMPGMPPMGYGNWGAQLNPWQQQQAMAAAQMAYHQSLMMMSQNGGSQAGDFEQRPISPSGSFTPGAVPHSPSPPAMGGSGFMGGGYSSPAPFGYPSPMGMPPYGYPPGGWGMSMPPGSPGFGMMPPAPFGRVDWSGGQGFGSPALNTQDTRGRVQSLGSEVGNENGNGDARKQRAS